MHELWRAGDLVRMLMVITTSAGFPPFGAAAFWGIVTLWGIVTILFDDETPRGVPGAEYWRAKPSDDANLHP